MKKKLIVAIPILVVIAVIVLILILTRDKEEDQDRFFADSGYPVSIEENGANLKVTLDGSKTKDLSWSVKVNDEAIVSVEPKGEEKKGKATFLVSPKQGGLVDVEFIRSGAESGSEVTAVNLVLPVLVQEEEGKLKAFCAEEAYIRSLNETGGSELEYPYFLENHEDGTAAITFPKGDSDWVFVDPDGVVRTGASVGENGESIRNVYREANSAEEPEAEESSKTYRMEYVKGEDGKTGFKFVEVEKADAPAPDFYDTEAEKYKGHSSIAEDGSGSTLLLAISKSQNVTEFIDVKISEGGRITLSLGKEPKD